MTPRPVTTGTGIVTAPAAPPWRTSLQEAISRCDLRATPVRVHAAAASVSFAVADRQELLKPLAIPDAHRVVETNGEDAASVRTERNGVRLLAHEAAELTREITVPNRFLSFLLTAVRHFVANEFDAARAQKRGGGSVALSFELDDGESRYLPEPVNGVTPEHIYERRWALTVLEAALTRVSTTYADGAREQLFLALRPVLTGEESESYAPKAASLGMTEGALRVALHRLRQQFSKCLREIVTETVERPEDVDEELRHLLAVLSPR